MGVGRAGISRRTWIPLRMKRGKWSGCGMISFKSSRIWGPVTGDVSAEVRFVWLSVSTSNARVHVVLLNVVLVHVSPSITG